MTEPYTVIDDAEQSRAATNAPAGWVRPVLWVLLVVFGTANAVASTINTLVGVAFGLLTLSCVAALVVHHRRYRRIPAGTASRG